MAELALAAIHTLPCLIVRAFQLLLLHCLGEHLDLGRGIGGLDQVGPRYLLLRLGRHSYVRRVGSVRGIIKVYFL